jgi:hypothetical protein
VYSDLWSPELRQGDVIGKIFFPTLGSQFQTVLTARSLVAAPAPTKLEVVQVPGDRRFAVVISHDCEFNEGKRNRLLVARVENVPGNLTDQQRQELRASNDVEAQANAGKDIAGVDSFVLDPVPGAFEEEKIAVFTTITPLPIKMKEEFLQSKRAEMCHEYRVLFRKKLAWFFGRDADDVDDAEKFQAPDLSERAAE